jgi:hypothetical protein
MLVQYSLIPDTGQWLNNLRDTDAGLRMFYEACVEAGPDACALYRPTANEVQERTAKIFAALKERPIAVTAPVNATSAELEYGIVDYTMARSTVASVLYGPYGRYVVRPVLGSSALATALAAAEVGDGRPMWSANKGKLAQLECECDESAVPAPLAGHETTLSIACGDADVVDDSVDELQKHFEGMAKFSDFAEWWDIHVSCAYVFSWCYSRWRVLTKLYRGWKIRAKERFTGPFVGNTSFPIMLIGNSADPVTSIWKYVLDFVEITMILTLFLSAHGRWPKASKTP